MDIKNKFDIGKKAFVRMTNGCVALAEIYSITITADSFSYAITYDNWSRDSSVSEASLSHDPLSLFDRENKKMKEHNDGTKKEEPTGVIKK